MVCFPVLPLMHNSNTEPLQDDEVKDAVSILSNSGSGSVVVVAPMDTQLGPTVDAHPRPHQAPTNPARSWIRRLKAKFAQHFGRQKQRPY